MQQLRNVHSGGDGAMQWQNKVASSIRRRREEEQVTDGDGEEERAEIVVMDAFCKPQVDYDFRVANLLSSAAEVEEYGAFQQNDFVEDVNTQRPQEFRYLNCSFASGAASSDDETQTTQYLYWVNSNCVLMSYQNATTLRRTEADTRLSSWLYEAHWETTDAGGYTCSDDYGCLSTANENAFLRCKVKAEEVSYTTTCSMSRLIKGIAPNLGACLCDSTDYRELDETCWTENKCYLGQYQHDFRCEDCVAKKSCECRFDPFGMTPDRHGIPFHSMDFFAWALSSSRYENYRNSDAEQIYSFIDEWSETVEGQPSFELQDLDIGMKTLCPDNSVFSSRKTMRGLEIGAVVVLYAAAVAAVAYCWNWRSNRLHPKIEEGFTNLMATEKSLAACAAEKVACGSSSQSAEAGEAKKSNKQSKSVAFSKQNVTLQRANTAPSPGRNKASKTSKITFTSENGPIENIHALGDIGKKSRK